VSAGGRQRRGASAFREIMRVGPYARIAAATSASGPCTMREAPLRMIASGIRHRDARRHAAGQRIAALGGTTAPAAKDSA